MSTRTALGLGAVLALALLALGLAQSEPGRSLLRDAGLSAPSEPFTALAFARPDDLPQRPAAGAGVPVAFRIANEEEGRRTYAWRVVERAAGGDGGGETLASGRVGVEPGAGATVRARVPLACAGRRTRVAVVLDDPAREIGFWVACPGPGATS